METVKKFWRYFTEILKEASEKKEATFGGVVAVFVVGLFLLKGNMGSLEKYKELREIGERVFFGLFLVWGFVWLPFRKHEKQQNGHVELMRTKDAAIKTLEEELNDQTAEKLAAQNAAADKQKKRELIGACLRNIRMRSQEISDRSKIPNFTIAEQKTTQEILQTVANILKDSVGTCEAEVFLAAKGQSVQQGPWDWMRQWHIYLLEAKFNKLEEIAKKYD